jgi:hypothetical protein
MVSKKQMLFVARLSGFWLRKIVLGHPKQKMFLANTCKYGGNKWADLLPPWPPPPPVPTGNVVHAPTPIRGASTALCALLPAQSTRLLLLPLCPLWLQKVHVHLCPASIPEASSLMLLELLAPTAGKVVRSMTITVRLCRTTSSSTFDVCRSLCQTSPLGRTR